MACIQLEKEMSICVLNVGFAQFDTRARIILWCRWSHPWWAPRFAIHARCCKRRQTTTCLHRSGWCQVRNIRLLCPTWLRLCPRCIVDIYKKQTKFNTSSSTKKHRNWPLDLRSWCMIVIQVQICAYRISWCSNLGSRRSGRVAIPTREAWLVLASLCL